MTAFLARRLTDYDRGYLDAEGAYYDAAVKPSLDTLLFRLETLKGDHSEVLAILWDAETPKSEKQKLSATAERIAGRIYFTERLVRSLQAAA